MNTIGKGWDFSGPSVAETVFVLLDGEIHSFPADGPITAKGGMTEEDCEKAEALRDKINETLTAKSTGK